MKDSQLSVTVKHIYQSISKANNERFSTPGCTYGTSQKYIKGE